MNYSFSLFFLRPPFLLPDPIRPLPLSCRDVFPFFFFRVGNLLLCFIFCNFNFRLSLRWWRLFSGSISGVKIWTAGAVRSQISPTTTRPGHSVAPRHLTNISDDPPSSGVLSSHPRWGWDCTSRRLREISHPGGSGHWLRPSDKTVRLSVRTVVSVSGPPSCGVLLRVVVVVIVL